MIYSAYSVKHKIIRKKYRSLGSYRRYSKKKYVASPLSPTKIIAIGLNYYDHAEEMKKEPPKEPLIFLKPPSTLIGANNTIEIPNHMSSRVDYEGELGIVIKEEAKWISKEKAYKYVLGGICANDITARDLQAIDVQFTRAKSFDTFCPVGPYVSDEIDYQNVKIKTVVNNEIKQESNTSFMIHKIDFIISYVSKIMTLNKGDLILTGTPGGIGSLHNKDFVSISIDGLGSTKNKVSLRIE